MFTENKQQFEAGRAAMEEDPTPVPSVGSRKHLITNEDGVITGEETLVDLGHTESGYVYTAAVHTYIVSCYVCASHMYEVDVAFPPVLVVCYKERLLFQAFI